jgi:hypothetical protein
MKTIPQLPTALMQNSAGTITNGNEISLIGSGAGSLVEKPAETNGNPKSLLDGRIVDVTEGVYREKPWVRIDYDLSGTHATQLFLDPNPDIIRELEGRYMAGVWNVWIQRIFKS